MGAIQTLQQAFKHIELRAALYQCPPTTAYGCFGNDPKKGRGWRTRRLQVKLMQRRIVAFNYGGLLNRVSHEDFFTQISNMCISKTL